MREFWIDVKDYIGLYQVSNWGRVKSVERIVIDIFKGKQRVRHFKENILRQTLNRGGYLQVHLSKNGVVKPKRVHVLAAQAFLPNPNNYSDVHHKDKNQLNNRFENLEWISKEEHFKLHESEFRDAAREGVRKALSKTVYQLQDDEIVNIWKSVREAARVLGLNSSHISACCRSERKTHGGFGWSYNPYTKKARI